MGSSALVSVPARQHATTERNPIAAVRQIRTTRIDNAAPPLDRTGGPSSIGGRSATSITCTSQWSRTSRRHKGRKRQRLYRRGSWGSADVPILGPSAGSRSPRRDTGQGHGLNRSCTCKARPTARRDQSPYESRSAWVQSASPATATSSRSCRSSSTATGSWCTAGACSSCSSGTHDLLPFPLLSVRGSRCVEPYPSRNHCTDLDSQTCAFRTNGSHHRDGQAWHSVGFRLM